MDPDTFTGTTQEPRRIIEVLAEEGFVVGPTHHVVRTLLDTFDGRLHSAGMRLELERNGDLELRLTAGGSTAATAVSGIPRFASDLPPGPLSARLAPHLDVRALLPVVTVEAQQTVTVLRDPAGKAVVRVMINHDLSLSDGTPLDEWTAELRELVGYGGPARQTRSLLQQSQLQPSKRSTLELAAAAAGIRVQGFHGSPTVALSHDASAFAGFLVVLANLADAIDANWQGTIDDVDPEFLHDLRVAVRRTRSVLGHAKGVLPEDVRADFSKGFAWLGKLTGPPRDLDVYVTEWDQYVAPFAPEIRAALAPVRDLLSAQRSHAHVVLADDLQSPGARTLMATWREWLDLAQEQANEGSPETLHAVARRRIVKAQKRLLARGRTIGLETPDEVLHDLRKDAKKLRYLLECFGGLYPAEARKGFVKRLKALQENLGVLQDAVVHAEHLEQVCRELPSSTDTDTWVAVGRLLERLELHRADARQEFAERFASYDTKKTRALLTDLVSA